MDAFIDSSVWIASRFEAGDRAEWARQYLDRPSGLFISEYIVDEVVAFCLGNRELKSRPARERIGIARKFLDIFQNSGAVEILPVGTGQFGEAKTLVEESGLGLSVTDWTDLVVARDRGIRDLCAFDNAFRDAVKLPGFSRIRIVPGDGPKD